MELQTSYKTAAANLKLGAFAIEGVKQLDDNTPAPAPKNF